MCSQEGKPCVPLSPTFPHEMVFFCKSRLPVSRPRRIYPSQAGAKCPMSLILHSEAPLWAMSEGTAVSDEATGNTAQSPLGGWSWEAYSGGDAAADPVERAKP